MSKIFGYFIQHWRLAFAVTAICLVAGIMGVLRLNREQFPPLNSGNIIITTLYPGASSLEVVDSLSRPLEDEIRGVDGLKDVTSISRSGLSRIVIRVDIDSYDPDSVLLDIQKSVDRAGPLPEGIPDNPKVDAIESSENPIVKLALTGDNTNRRRDILADRLQDRLEFITGVSRVDREGYSEREFQILLDRKKLASRHISVNDVSNAIQSSVQNIPAGDIEHEGERKLVRMTGKVVRAVELERIVLRSNIEGGKVLVRDVARVRDGARDPELAVSFDGRPATTLTVVKKGAADAIQTVEHIMVELEIFRRDLPKGYDLIIYENEAEQVRVRLGIVLSNAMFGFVLVLVLLLIFFPGRVGYVSALSLPVAVLLTVGLMPVLGTSFNTITMMALVVALGLMVDNAIVISENYIRLREDGLAQLAAAKTAVEQFWLPITATALTTIAAFLPMFLTRGIMGEVVKFIPIVITIAILASLLECFVLLPARLRFTLARPLGAEAAQPSAKGHWFSGIEKRFESFIAFCLRRRTATIAAIAGLVAGSVLLSVFGNYFDLFPRERVEVYLAKIEGREGTTLARTLSDAEAYAARIRETIGPEHVKNIIITAGSTQDSQMDTYARFGDHTGRIRIILDRKFAWSRNTEEFLGLLRSVDQRDFLVVTFDAIAAGPSVGKSLEVTLSSNSETELKQAVSLFKDRLGRIKGVHDIADDNPPGGPEITFLLEESILRAAGLSNQDLGLTLRTALEGDVASSLNVDGEEVDLRVQYDGAYRKSIENLTGTKMTTASGNLVPVGRVARVQEATGVAQVKRYQFRRAISVSADVDNENMTAVELNRISAEIQPEIQEQFPGIYFSYLGQAESFKESLASLFRAFIIAALAIMIILVFLFDSYVYPLIIISAIPLGLVGVGIAFFLHFKPLSFFALVGIIGLAGVVVNDTIILVSYARLLKKEGRYTGYELLRRATVGRLKPVLVTTLTTVGGLLPTAYGIGGYDSNLVPLTLAMAWGLAGGTFLTLVLTPCLLSFTKEFAEEFAPEKSMPATGLRRSLRSRIMRFVPTSLQDR